MYHNEETFLKEYTQWHKDTEACSISTPYIKHPFWKHTLAITNESHKKEVVGWIFKYLFYPGEVDVFTMKLLSILTGEKPDLPKGQSPKEYADWWLNWAELNIPEQSLFSDREQRLIKFTLERCGAVHPDSVIKLEKDNQSEYLDIGPYTIILSIEDGIREFRASRSEHDYGDSDTPPSNEMYDLCDYSPRLYDILAEIVKCHYLEVLENALLEFGETEDGI